MAASILPGRPVPRLQQSRHDTNAFSLLMETAQAGLVKGGAGVPSH